ncbi:MAG: hypothetical protein D3922_15530 [Candidatus Electrothrix sp. AR1]|nr:hypothetical protein [Candidatus Electrothrix sp. AR1]
MRRASGFLLEIRESLLNLRVCWKGGLWNALKRYTFSMKMASAVWPTFMECSPWGSERKLPVLNLFVAINNNESIMLSNYKLIIFSIFFSSPLSR